MIPQKRWFPVTLKTWPGGNIRFLAFASSKEEAQEHAHEFMWRMRYAGKVGKVEEVA
jgi:hypothetical protein